MPASADELVADLSTSQVTIQTDFTGETILLFGAIDTSSRQTGKIAPSKLDTNTLDIIIIIRGPNQALTIRRKDRTFGIWANNAALPLQSVPAYYAVAASRPLTHIATPQELTKHGAGLAYLPIQQASHTPATQADDSHTTQQQSRAFIDGLIRNKKARGLYSEVSDGVRIIGGRLFRAEIALPSGVPVGNYRADILLFRNGKVVSKQSNALNVDIRGIEQLLYMLAHQLPAFYGAVGVLIAFVSGWGAAILFRRRA
ncbi:MAG: TIGR02186 family protein [Alphaproteobacteria bacterium]|nr:TIGR02186 family protein [Alphaproteobacteria bacterium]